MNEKRTQGQKLNRKRPLLIIFAIVVVLVAGILVLILFHHADSQHPATSHPQVSKMAKQSTQSSNGTNVLTDFTEKATEDADTRTGGDVTYSQFYKHGNDWYWKLTSNNRGTVEIGRISKVVADNENYVLSVTSQVYQSGTPYHLTLHWLNQKAHQYNLHTDFKDINGDYTQGAPAVAQPVNTRNLTKAQIKNWIVRNINKYEPAPGNQKQNNDPGYYYFQFSKDKNGCIGIWVTENHDYANAHGDDVDPQVSPTVGDFQITKEGYLKVASNVGTAGFTMIKKITGDYQNQSCIVARTFEE